MKHKQAIKNTITVYYYFALALVWGFALWACHNADTRVYGN
jgi:hypothetical protein